MAARATLTSPMYSSRYSGSSVYNQSYNTSSRYSTSRNLPPTSDIKHRPLPTGRGPLDARGKKLNTEETIRSLKNAGGVKSTGYHCTSDSTGYSRTKPFKADHSVLLGASSRTYSPSLYTATPPRSPSNTYNSLPRTRRSGSVTELASKFERNEITDNHSFASSKLYGSNQDISTASVDRTPRKENYGSTIRRRDSNAGSGTLPDITKTSRLSPSESSKLAVEKTQRRTSLQSSFTSYNGRSSPDNNRCGLVGLRNLGNTCFMNSILQCLSNTKQLRCHFLDDTYQSDINTSTSNMKGALVNAFAKLMKNMWKASNSDSHVSPTEFKSQIARFAKRFVGYNQQDAQEFLIYLLEGLHEDLNRVKEKKKRIIPNEEDDDKLSASAKSQESWKRYLDHDNSQVVDTFVGQLKSSLKCTVCGYVSNTFDPFWDLSLPIKKGRGYNSEVSLDSCFELFTQEEVLDGDEKPTCAKCKKRQKCTKGFSIQKFPKVLIIQLKRFSQETMLRSKLSTFVTYRVKSLDLTNYAAEKNGTPAIYNLYAVCNHSGTPYGGHYTAYVKHPLSGEWNYFNDTRVSSISESKVISSEGYVLFYELSGTSSRL